MSHCNRNEGFFKREILIYYEHLYKFIFTSTNDSDLSRDIVQETMIKAWESIHRIKKYENKRYALRIIAKNMLYNHYKKKMNNEIPVFQMEIEEALYTRKDSLANILNSEERRSILKAIGNLNEAHMQVILLRYYYDQSFKDIARITQRNYNTILSRHRRAIRVLKDYLGKNKK